MWKKGSYQLSAFSRQFKPLSAGDEPRVHELVLMPNHFHLLITPLAALERLLQLIGSCSEIWEKSFYDRRPRLGGIFSTPSIHSSESSEARTGAPS
jgi:REP element-mobilizing transposase RayT